MASLFQIVKNKRTFQTEVSEPVKLSKKEVLIKRLNEHFKNKLILDSGESMAEMRNRS